MGKRLFLRIICNFNKINSNPTLCVFGNIRSKKLHTNEIPVKEIQIPTQWGHLAAKLWGGDQNRPIFALHGWQENAGIWDPIAPMLCQKRSILAVDFPGHGLSSWIPSDSAISRLPDNKFKDHVKQILLSNSYYREDHYANDGMQYYTWEFSRIIMYLREYFKWDKVTLLCHSMGSMAGMRYACIFPDEVDFYIAIDSIVYDDYDLNFVKDKYAKLLQKGLIAQSRLNEEPPSYTLEEITKILHNGTNKSTALNSLKYLLTRGAKQSKYDADKYYFSRDPRLKYTLFNPEDKTFVEAIVKKLKSPTLYIKAIDSPFASDAFSVEMREIIERNNDKFECHFVPGTHHVHFNNPERVAPLIVNFLKKYNIDI